MPKRLCRRHARVSLVFDRVVAHHGAHSLMALLAASVFYGLGAGLLLPALLTWILNMVRPERRSSASATFYNMLDIGTSTGILVLGVIAGMVAIATCTGASQPL